MVRGAGLQPDRGVVGRGVQPVDAHLLKEVASYGRQADVRAEELVSGAGDNVGPYSIAVDGDVRGGVHGVDGDEASCLVGPIDDGGNVVNGAHGVGREAHGDESGTIGNLRFEVVKVEG